MMARESSIRQLWHANLPFPWMQHLHEAGTTKITAIGDHLRSHAAGPRTQNCNDDFAAIVTLRDEMLEYTDDILGISSGPSHVQLTDALSIGKWTSRDRALWKQYVESFINYFHKAFDACESFITKPTSISGQSTLDRLRQLTDDISACANDLWEEILLRGREIADRYAAYQIDQKEKEIKELREQVAKYHSPGNLGIRLLMGAIVVAIFAVPTLYLHHDGFFTDDAKKFGLPGAYFFVIVIGAVAMFSGFVRDVVHYGIQTISQQIRSNVENSSKR